MTFRKSPRQSPRTCLRVENLEARTTPTVFNVSPVASPTPTNNDYTVIQDAVNAAAPGDSIVLAGTFDFTEPNAAASWAKGADGVANTFDDYSVYVPEGKTQVTFTAASLGDAVIQGPGDLPQLDLEAFLYFDGLGYQGWTISNLDIRDFDMGIGMFGTSETDDTYRDLTITNNRIRVSTDLNGSAVPTDPLQNVAIVLGVGRNQTVSNNQIEIPGDGVSDPTANQGDFDANPEKFATTVGVQTANTAGDLMDNLAITGNTITVLNPQSAFPERVIGVWDNSTAHRSDITVANNQFQNASPANDPTRNRQQAFWVTSHSNTSAGTTVAYTGNTVAGVSLGFRFDSQYDLGSQAGVAPIQFTGNTLTDVWGGFLVQANGLADLSDNALTGVGVAAGAETGILVRPGSTVTLDDSSGVNSLTGFATGILSQGKTRVDGARITGNGVGILADLGAVLVERTDLRNNEAAGLIIRNGALVDAGQVATPTFTPVDYTGLGISSGKNNFADGYAAGGGQAIVNRNTGPGYSGPGPDVPPGHTVYAQGNFWAHLNAAFIESVVYHDLDDPALGYVDYASAAAENDLAVTARFVTDPAFVGQRLTLLVKVTNFGPSDATGVVATADVPAGTTFRSAETDRGTVSEAGGVVTASIGALGRGESAIIRIVVIPTAPGAITSTAQVRSGGTDPEPANNTASADATVTAAAGGVVTVGRIYGRLYLIGDGADNAVQVVAGGAAREYQVIGLAGTQVRFRGATGPTATVGRVRYGISSSLDGGDDTLIVDGSGTNERLAILGGVAAGQASGNDTFYLLHASTTANVSVFGGAGDSTTTVDESRVGVRLRWFGAGGTDRLAVTDSSVVFSLLANAGAGDDRIDLRGVNVGLNVFVAAGAGNDQVDLTGVRAPGTVLGGTTYGGSTAVFGGQGDDAVTVNGGSFRTFWWAGGTGGDDLSISDAFFSGAFAAGGRAGDDRVTVARSTFLGASVLFGGGAGTDTLDIGYNSNPVGSARGNVFALTPAAFGFENIVS